MRLCSVPVHRWSSTCDHVVRMLHLPTVWYRQLAACETCCTPGLSNCDNFCAQRTNDYRSPTLATPPTISKTLSVVANERVHGRTVAVSSPYPLSPSAPTPSVHYDRSLLCAKCFCTHTRLHIIRQYPSTTWIITIVSDSNHDENVLQHRPAMDDAEHFALTRAASSA